MGAAIFDAFGVEPELIKGKNGIFDVKVDGTLVFSKHKAGRFPDNDEILSLLRRQ